MSEVTLTTSECHALKYYIREYLIESIKKDEFVNNFDYVKSLCDVYEKCKEATTIDLMEWARKLP